MQAYVYPAHVAEIAPGDFEVRFRDVPEAITGGGDAAAALAEAPDALAAAVEGYLELARPVPAPSALQRGELGVPLSPPLAARVLLTQAMQAQGLSKVALAQRWGRDEKVVRRVLSGRGASLELTLAALGALGVRPALAA